jgi:tetratricopeptide (TPR) repeat protein
MKHFWLCLFLGIPSLAAASPYSDFSAGLAALAREDGDGAMAAFNAALAAPDLLPAFRATAYFDRGRIYADNKKWDLAIADFTAALKIDPDYLDAYDQRSQAYKSTKHLDLAIADLTAILSRRPSFLNFYLRRAELHSENHSMDDAIADANTIVRIAPELAWGYQIRGKLYHTKGDIALALADDEKALSIDRREGDAYFDRGSISAERGEFQRAADDFAKALEMNPLNAWARFRIGVTAWELGRFDDAAQVFSNSTVTPDGVLAVNYILWRWIASTKTQKDSALNAPAKQAASDEWPKPLLDLYAGKGSIEAVMKSAGDTVSAGTTNRICGANFYGGIWEEVHGDKSTATKMLSDAASGCPVTYLERSAASAELSRLK